MFAADVVSVISSSFQIREEILGRRGDVPTLTGPPSRQRYSVQKGIKKFGKKGKNAAYKEMRQLHERVVFKPIK